MNNNLSYLDTYIKKSLSEKSALSTMFKRHRMKTPLIGDIPIIKHIITICNQNSRTFTRQQVRYALNYSIEFSQMDRSLQSEVFEDVFNSQNL